MSTTLPPTAAGEEQARRATAGAVTLIEAAEAAWASGLDVVSSAPTLRAVFAPDIPTLAQVLAAVWWATLGTKPRVLLATALTAAYPEAPPIDITDATHRAVSRAQGIYIRKGLDDAGQIPYEQPLNGSPDINPAGTSPIPDPQTYYRQNWGNDPATKVERAVTNYVYVRGMNLFPGAEDGEIHLYWCRATTYEKPSVWASQPVPNQAGPTAPARVSAAAAGDVVVGETPFLWTGPIDQDYYFLIARVVSRFAPNPIPPDGTFGMEWLRWHPGFAQRLFSFAAAGALEARTLRVGFGNPDAAPGRFLLVADCRGLSGAAVSLASRGEVAFDTGPRAVAAEGGQIEVAVELPAGYDGDVEVGIGPAGALAEAAARPGAVVDVRLYQLVGPGHEAFVFARSPEELGIAAEGPSVGGALPVLVGSVPLRFE
jgi:hypothetical protein